MPYDKKENCVYVNITETPDTKGSREQITRLYTRYRFASEFCKDKDVLEVACGAGIGLGYLARYARTVVGGDIDESNIKYALQTYKERGNIEIRFLDAHQLPFPNKSFDVVILYEAIYYLKHPEKFVDEAYRVLRDKGVLIICSVNKDWSDFNPSPYSQKYFSSSELYSLLEERGFEVKLFAECLARTESLLDKIVSFLKRTAVKLHLIPKTMKGKERLKRIFFGKLISLPSEISDDITEYIPPVPISGYMPIRDYKVIYAIGHVK